MIFNIGDKIKYRDFLVELHPHLAGTFVVEKVHEINGEHEGFISASGLPSCICSEDFVLADKKWVENPAYKNAVYDLPTEEGFSKND